MWVTRKSYAPRVVSRRFVSLVAVALITAVFAVLGPLIRPVSAESATWSGEQLTYEGNTYTKEGAPISASDARGRAGQVAYTWVETASGGNQKAHTIFFSDANNIQSEKTAILVVYDYTPPNTYSNGSSPTTVDITTDLTATASDTETSCSSDVHAGLGWIFCPISDYLAGVVDYIYNLIKAFLDVPPLTTDTANNATYDVWKIMLAIANVCFVIVFLLIIFSQITGAGFSNYSLKSMLPRLIIAALLVNLSYWICAVAIDASNILGHSIQSILNNIRENITISNGAAFDAITWQNITAAVLSGGALTAGGVSIGLASAGYLPAIGFMLLAALVSVVFAVFVAFVILAARQALITIFTIISPLAFVAYVLPNTEEYFTKWRKAFMALLLFFPIFALVFGGSQLAGTILIQQGITTNRLEIILLGLVVQFMALFITPLIINFSQGLLGRFAGMVNDRSKGPLDKFRNWANENAEAAAAKRRGDIAEKIKGNRGKSGLRSRAWRTMSYVTPGGMSTRNAMAKINRDIQKSTDESRLHSYATGTNRGQRVDTKAREADQLKRETEGAHEAEWNARHDRYSSHFNRDSLKRELNIKQLENKSEIHKGKFQAAQSAMSAGENVYADIATPKDGRFFDSITASYRDDAEIIALTGERKARADRKTQQYQAKRLGDETLTYTIDGQSLRAYSAGIMGEEGVRAVVAQAKAQVSSAMMEDIKHINNTIDYNITGDANLSIQAFKGSRTMTERIAHMMSFSTQGTAGDVNMRDAVKYMEGLLASNQISSQDMLDFKELAINMVPNVTGQGEDMKRYLGTATKRWSDLVNSPKDSWLKASPDGFASAAPIAQIKILEALANVGDDKIRDFVERLSSQNISALKDATVVSAIKMIKDGSSANDILTDQAFVDSLAKNAQYYT